MDKSLKLYEEMIRGSDEMIQNLKKLDGKQLGCWCKPWSCHGDVLRKLFIEFYGSSKNE